MSGPFVEGGLPRRDPELHDRYESEIEKLLAGREERIRAAAEGVAEWQKVEERVEEALTERARRRDLIGPTGGVDMHLHVPGRWVCLDGCGDWPCDGARARLRRQMPDRAALRDYMLHCWRRAAEDLGASKDPEAGILYRHFVAWTGPETGPEPVSG